MQFRAEHPACQIEMSKEFTPVEESPGSTPRDIINIS
jgi:hypothetical protein